MRTKLIGFGVAGVLILSAGCSKRIAAVKPPAPSPAPVVATTAPAPASKPEPVRVAENRSPRMPDQATKDRIQDLLNRMQDVYFDYDQRSLRPDAQSTLQADATTLRQILEQKASATSADQMPTILLWETHER